ncbi:MAG: transposase [Acidimicrobiia bacterium]
MNRGNRKARIFEDDSDRHRFMQLLAELAATYQVQVLTDSLMGNHFHLIVRTPHANVSAFMQQLEGQYAQYSNWRHNRVGHLFQDRFKGVVIESDVHLFTAFWYVATNAVVARYVQRPEQWPWSSYRATVGLAKLPGYLSVDWVAALFAADSLCESQRLCRRCMNDAQPVQAFLQASDPSTADSVRSYISERLSEVQQPCALNDLLRPPLEQVFSKTQSRTQFTKAVVLAHEKYLYTLAEIARHRGRTSAGISRTYCIAKKRR